MCPSVSNSCRFANSVYIVQNAIVLLPTVPTPLGSLKEQGHKPIVYPPACKCPWGDILFSDGCGMVSLAGKWRCLEPCQCGLLRGPRVHLLHLCKTDKKGDHTALKPASWDVLGLFQEKLIYFTINFDISKHVQLKRFYIHKLQAL